MATEKDKENKPYSEQCFIKDFMDFFVSIHGSESQRDPLSNSQHFKNARHKGIISQPLNLMKVDRNHLRTNTAVQSESADEGSVSFMTRLSSPSAQSLLENVPKEMLSNLQPKIELYKIFYTSENDKTGVPVPLPLNNFAAPDEMTFKQNPGPGAQYTGPDNALPGHLAVGLKDLSFDYLGTNPAEVDYFINVNLRLWFSTADAMFHGYPIPENIKEKLGAGTPPYVSFADLIMRPQKYTESPAHDVVYGATNHMAWDPKYFRIRIDISYADAVSAEWLEEAVAEIYSSSTFVGPPDYRAKAAELREALSTIKSSFYLNLLRHTFNFRGDLPSSPFEVNITYNGAVETALYSPDADILRGNARDEARVKELQEADHSWWSIMNRHAQNIRTNYGFDPQGYNKAEFFAFKDQRRVAGLGFGGAATVLLPDRGQYPAYVSDPKAIPDEARTFGQTASGVERFPFWGGAEGSSIKIPFSAATDATARLGNELIGYMQARANWRNTLHKANQRDDQLKTSNYTRLLDELTGHPSTDQEKKCPRRNRFYQLAIPNKMITDYNRFARNKALTDNEQEQIKKIQDGLGSNAKNNRKEIEKVRQQRENRLRGGGIVVEKDQIRKEGKTDVLFERRLIYKYLYKELNKSSSPVWETPVKAGEDQFGSPALGTYGEGGIPLLNTRDGNQKVIVKWKDRIGQWVAQQEGYAGDDEMEESDLNPEIIAPDGKSPHEWYNISWLYFGDIIDAALEIVRETDINDEKLQLDLWRAPDSDDKTQLGGSLKVILGDVTYFDQIEGKKKTINLVDLPVSFELFREFWTSKVIKPMRERYSFMAFLRDAMTELVQAALTNKCAERGEPIVGIKPHIFQQSIPKNAEHKVFSLPPRGDVLYAAGKSPNKQFAKSLDRVWRAHIAGTNPGKPNKLPMEPEGVELDPTKGAPADIVAPTIGINKEVLSERQEIIYLCATTDKPTSFMVADKKKDLENGIFYLEVGTDGTPVQSISFTKMDQPFYLEAKGDTSGFKGEPLVLSEPYNCTFSLFGNNFLKPGVFVYIRLPHFGLPKNKFSPAQRLGLGGYFMITKTSNSLVLAGNKIDWSTDVVSVWNSFGDKDALANKNRAHY